MSGQHCEIYDVKRETVHCYPVNSSLLTAVAPLTMVASNGWNLSAVFKFCFCFVLLSNKSLNDSNHLMTNHLMTRISMFPSTSSRETLRFSGNKFHCSPRDQSLSVYYYSTNCNTIQIWSWCSRYLSSVGNRYPAIYVASYVLNVTTAPF